MAFKDQLDTFLRETTDAIDIPNEGEVVAGDNSNVSQEVDENGVPLDPEKQKTVRQSDFRSFIPGAEAFMGVEEYTNVWKEDSGDKPYCPVYADKNADGSVNFTAYLEGAINDVDDYIDLIDTLLIAREQDKYSIIEDSPGGLIASGGIIASAIHHSKAEVRTIAAGMVASAAALIHSAAKPGFALTTPYATFMYHMSSHWDGGYSTKVKERAENQVRYVNECLLNKALEDGHITKDEFDKIQNGKEIYVTAEEFTRRTSGQTPTENTDAGTENYAQDMSLTHGDDLSIKSATFYKNLTDHLFAIPQWTNSQKPDFIPSNADFEPEMDEYAVRPQRGGNMPLLIRTSDKKNFRIYLKAEWRFTQKYINGLVRFLDTRTEDQTVTFILGAKTEDWMSYMLAPICAAMSRCKATINTIAAGYCSMMETMIWLMGQNKDVYRYGALTFCQNEIVANCPALGAFFEQFFQKALQENILSQDDLDMIHAGSEKMILYGEYKAKFPD